MVSTAPHTPTHDLKYDFDIEDTDVDKLADLKNDVFDEARQRVGAAWRAGQWLDFGNGSIESPRVHPWPVNDTDEPFEPGQLNEAYAVFDIPDTYCLCATQEFDPTQREQHSPHPGCLYQGEPSRQVPLHLLYGVSRLITAKYPKREVPGPGIFKFNGFKLSKSPSTLCRTPVSVKRPATESQGSPLKYQHTLPSTSKAVKGKRKAKRESSMSPLSSKFSTGATGLPLTLSDEEGDTEEDDSYISNYLKASPSPLPRTRPLQVSSMLDLPLRYSTHPPPNSVSTPVASPSSSSRRLTHWEPNQCFFGDVMGLAEPVNPSLLPYCNYQVSLSQEKQHHYLHKLDLGGSIPHELFMMIFDKCNCDLYFLKDFLHCIHGPTCPDYLYTPPQYKNRPLGSTAVQAIQDAIAQQPPSPPFMPHLPPASSHSMGVGSSITPPSASRRPMAPTASPFAARRPSMDHTFALPPAAGRASAPPHTYSGATWLGPGTAPFPTTPATPTAPVIPTPSSALATPVITTHSIPTIPTTIPTIPTTIPTIPTITTVATITGTMPSTPIGPSHSRSPTSISPSISLGSSSSFDQELDKFIAESPYMQ
ncbi:hypothetical protein M422DRAFT_272787 [Sphaerobolus stellatus SS14]|uniref:Uncharacterized protein n=1 Tax=Sphaerobolus stellatus (strain SS14) TaxID=990650 RepID=A0A0C9UKZ4_SPHS4|nr:hypothetical protein M422DRAFT_272787 [Sphaerobolus stellatus SS14]